jgi:HEAT repeat protein
MVNRTIKTKQRRHAQKMKELYQVELTDYLFGEENQSFGFTGIKNNTNREIFINELLSLHNNLYGEAATRLRDLFFNLELYKDSLIKTHNRRWNIKAKGIGELAQMDVKDANNEIVKYANSKNQILRMEAQVALVKLNDSDPLFFLDDLKYELSEWEQINILNTLMHYQINIESFERWMSSKNNTVVVFAVKMAGLFKHIQSWPKVLELLEHEDPKVRLAAIKTLDMFEVAENAGPFKAFYEKEQAIEEKEDDVFYNLNMNRNRLAAMNALETVVTPNDIEFIEKVLATEKDFKIQQRVVNLILKSIPNGQAIIDRAYVNADLQLKKIIDHAKQTVEQ